MHIPIGSSASRTSGASSSNTAEASSSGTTHEPAWQLPVEVSSRIEHGIDSYRQAQQDLRGVEQALAEVNADAPRAVDGQRPLSEKLARLESTRSALKGRIDALSGGVRRRTVAIETLHARLSKAEQRLGELNDAMADALSTARAPGAAASLTAHMAEVSLTPTPGPARALPLAPLVDEQVAELDEKITELDSEVGKGTEQLRDWIHIKKDFQELLNESLSDIERMTSEAGDAKDCPSIALGLLGEWSLMFSSDLLHFIPNVAPSFISQSRQRSPVAALTARGADGTARMAPSIVEQGDAAVLQAVLDLAEHCPDAAPRQALRAQSTECVADYLMAFFDHESDSPPGPEAAQAARPPLPSREELVGSSLQILGRFESMLAAGEASTSRAAPARSRRSGRQRTPAPLPASEARTLLQVVKAHRPQVAAGMADSMQGALSELTRGPKERVFAFLLATLGNEIEGPGQMFTMGISINAREVFREARDQATSLQSAALQNKAGRAVAALRRDLSKGLKSLLAARQSGRQQQVRLPEHHGTLQRHQVPQMRRVYEQAVARIERHRHDLTLGTAMIIVDINLENEAKLECLEQRPPRTEKMLREVSALITGQMKELVQLRGALNRLRQEREALQRGTTAIGAPAIEPGAGPSEPSQGAPALASQDALSAMEVQRMRLVGQVENLRREMTSLDESFAGQDTSLGGALAQLDTVEEDIQRTQGELENRRAQDLGLLKEKRGGASELRKLIQQKQDDLAEQGEQLLDSPLLKGLFSVDALPRAIERHLRPTLSQLLQRAHTQTGKAGAYSSPALLAQAALDVHADAWQRLPQVMRCQTESEFLLAAGQYGLQQDHLCVHGQKIGHGYAAGRSTGGDPTPTPTQFSFYSLGWTPRQGVTISHLYPWVPSTSWGAAPGPSQSPTAS